MRMKESGYEQDNLDRQDLEDIEEEEEDDRQDDDLARLLGKLIFKIILLFNRNDISANFI
jgi:hypothetical protein